MVTATSPRRAVVSRVGRARTAQNACLTGTAATGESGAHGPSAKAAAATRPGSAVGNVTAQRPLVTENTAPWMAVNATSQKHASVQIALALSPEDRSFSGWTQQCHQNFDVRRQN